MRPSFSFQSLLILFVSIFLVASCSLINPNHKIAGKYELTLEDQSTTKKKKKNSIGNFLGKTILNNMVRSDVEFKLDGTADLNFDVFGLKLGDEDGDFQYEIKNFNTLILSSDKDDAIEFDIIDTDEGFKLKGEEVTFVLKRKEE